MKNTVKELRIVHRGKSQSHNGESAEPGTASVLVNMREREQSLEVVGQPRQIDQLQSGDKVLLIDNDRTLVLRDNDVMCDGTVVLSPASQVFGGHVVGPLVVIVTADGPELLHFTTNGYRHLDLRDALPQVHLSAVETSTMTVNVPDFEFLTPYNTWQAPLSGVDTSTLKRIVSQGYGTMLSDATSQGRFAGIVLARYGVRLWDDSYLWLSQPVMLGQGMKRNSYRASGTVYTSDGKYAGVTSLTLSAQSFRIGISMAGTVAEQWHNLVKSIDVLVSPQANLYDLGASVDYRCAVTTSSGTRHYLLEVGPRPRSTASMVRQLIDGEWTVLASTTALTGNGFTAINMAVSSQSPLPGVRCDAVVAIMPHAEHVSRSTMEQVMSRISLTALGEVSMEHNGRLYQAPSSFAVTNLWHVLPWLEGDISSAAIPTTVRVTMRTSQGEQVIESSGMSNFTATALNPVIAFSDSRATHIAIAVGNAKWECDLSPMQGTGMAMYINPSFSSNALAAGSLPDIDPSRVVVPADGTVMVSAVGNPLVTQWKTAVIGCAIMALGAACRPIYSGGFGRYPIYLFTNQGIMALPQSTSGTYGEPRLITETVLACGSHPVAGGDALWFVNQHNVLCSISGSKLMRLMRDINPSSQLAWNDREQELWIANPDGSVQVLMPSGQSYERDITIGNLYSNPQHAMAINGDGALLNLCDEVPSMTGFSYLSHPFSVTRSLCRHSMHITYNIFNKLAASPAGDVVLTLRGERGASCHGYIISRVHASGRLAAPLSRPLISPPTRTMRIEASGTLPSGTLFLPTLIKWS